MTANYPIRVVVSDSCVVINLIHVNRLGLFGALKGHEFVIPDHVYAEIVDPDQRATLDQSIADGHLKVESITAIDEISTYTSLRASLGSGEAACLVMAEVNGWYLASDEKKAFRREAIKRLGTDKLLTTPHLFVAAIQQNLVTIEDADRDKATLEQFRFKMGFASFRKVTCSSENLIQEGCPL